MAEEYKSANNRSYYAIFQAVNAVHALNGDAFKRHKDAIGNFNKNYVKTEIFSSEIGKKSVRWKRYVMQAIMMISMLPAEKSLSDKLRWRMNL